MLSERTDKSLSCSSLVLSRSAFFILAEQEEIQVEAAGLVVIPEIGEGDGLFLELFQRLRYELDVLLFFLLRNRMMRWKKE